MGAWTLGRVGLPVLVVVAYFNLVHLVLDSIGRYAVPVIPLYLILALVAVRHRPSGRHGARTSARSRGGGGTVSAASARAKVKTLAELATITVQLRAAGKTVAHCHGVFDLVHPGHIRHFEAASRLGDVLIVTVTRDEFVNKGPGRPVFPEQLRAESIAALGCVDYVAINKWPTAVETIALIKPDVYVKEATTHVRPTTSRAGSGKERGGRARCRLSYASPTTSRSARAELLNTHFDVYRKRAQSVSQGSSGAGIRPTR